MTSTNSYSAFQVDSQDVWDADDGDYNRLISIQAAHKTAKKVLDSHSQELMLLDKQTSPSKTSPTPHGSCSFNLTNFSVPTKNAPGMGVRLRSTPEDETSIQQRMLDRNKVNRFQSAISSPVTDLVALRKLAWSGIPAEIRPTVWKLLCGYLPAASERRTAVLTDKRSQYAAFINQYFHLRSQASCNPMFQQIQKDLTRMTLLYRRPEMLSLFERILFIWSMRHPGSGYVQGINDLLTPFFVVFLSEHTKVDLTTSCELSFKESDLNESILSDVEADVFWCTSHLLDDIQDNYTFAQPGIQNNLSMLASLVERIDARLHRHIVSNSVEYLQFAFRWMNNLLIRELPLRCIIRLWDAYMAEKSGFSNFHVYVCAAFLLQFSADLLRESDFQDIIVLLQRLPTFHWTDEHINLILAEGYKLQSLFASAPSHLDFKRHSELD